MSKSTWLIAAVIAVAPLAAGGARPEVKLALAVPALVALLFAAGRGRGLPWPLWPPLLLAGWYAFQLVPISSEWLGILSPRAAGLRTESPSGTGLTLSLDPSATAVGLALQAAFAAVMVAAFWSDRRGQGLILQVLAGVGALVATIGLLHWTSGATTLYGIYSPCHVHPLTGFFGTFVHNDTLAGFEVLTGLVALGLLARVEGSGPQAAALGAVILCFTAVMLAGSRGGYAALGVGIAMFIWLAHREAASWQAEGADLWRGRARLASYTALVLVVVGLAMGTVWVPGWANTLAQGPEGAPSAGLDLIRAFWLTGSGRETFALIQPAGLAPAVHPDSHLLQLACEAGLPGLVLGVGGGLAALKWVMPEITRLGTPTDWGLVAGLSGCGVQQAMDCGLASAGLALPVAAALGVALARAQGRRSGLALPAWMAAPGLGILAVAGLALVVYRWLAP